MLSTYKDSIQKKSNKSSDVHRIRGCMYTGFAILILLFYTAEFYSLMSDTDIKHTTN